MIEPILLAIADERQRRQIVRTLVGDGYRVIEETSGKRAIELVRRRTDIALVLAEVNLADVAEINFIKQIHNLAAYMPIVALGWHEDDPHLVQALNSGANEFLLLPISVLRLQTTIKNIFRYANLEHQSQAVRRFAEDHLKFKDLIAKNPKVQAFVSEAKKQARRFVNILLAGEEGCEHEVVARVIHREHTPRSGAFVRVQCMDFSHDEVARQDWIVKTKSKLHEAEQGSLLFANIERLDMAMQHMLLTLLNSLPLASESQTKTVRLLTTTTIDIQVYANERKFDTNLLAILGEVCLKIPPLRERRQDLELLCQAIFKVVVAETGRRQIHGIGERALSLLAQHDWPGNITELENALYRAVLLSDGPVLSPQDFPQLFHRQRLENFAHHLNKQTLFSPQVGDVFWDEFGHIRPLEALEKQMIEVALHRYGGKASEVARRLNISRATLYRKMKLYQISAKTSSSK